jgi:hypothetical protein
VVNRRVSSWSFLLLVILAWATIRPAGAKPRDLSSYTLRVHIFQSNWNPHAGAFGGQGSGLANLIDGQEVHAIDFTYDCAINYMKSVGNQAYSAKWKKPGKTIEIVGNAIGNESKSEACEFKITLHEFVYDVQNGTLSTFTPEQYKVRIGAALPKTEPIDTDMSHYPVRLSILAIEWTPLVNGTRTGSGRGNIMTDSGLSSVDFTTSCIVTLKVSEQGRYYAGQWTREGSVLTLFLHTAGDKPSSFLCTLQTSVHTDIYIREASGGIKAISADEYRRTILKVTTPAVATVPESNKPDGASSAPGIPSGNGPPTQEVTQPEVVTEPNKSGGANSPTVSAQTVSLYRRACDGGSATGCRNLAILYSTGNGVAKDTGWAATYYRKGCDKGDAGSCSNLGLLYANGTGVPQDDVQAVTLYRKACDAEDATACNNLGLMFINGKGVPKDFAQALALYRKACDGGVVASCSNLGVMYANGDGVPRDYTQAVALYRKACDAGLFGPCVNLGIMYENGTGIPRDHAQAISLFRKACDGGVAIGCNNLGVVLEKEKDATITPH